MGMRKIVLLCLVLVTVVIVAACDGNATSSPVTPDTANLAVTTADSQQWQGPWNGESRKVCHHNPDYASDGGYEWTVIQVNVGGQLNAHCGYQRNNRHGDYTTGGFQTCGHCYLEGHAIGADCSACD